MQNHCAFIFPQGLVQFPFLPRFYVFLLTVVILLFPESIEIFPKISYKNHINYLTCVVQRYIKEIELLLVAREIYSGIIGKNYLDYKEVKIPKRGNSYDEVALKISSLHIQFRGPWIFNV